MTRLLHNLTYTTLDFWGGAPGTRCDPVDRHRGDVWESVCRSSEIPTRPVLLDITRSEWVPKGRKTASRTGNGWRGGSLLTARATQVVALAGNPRKIPDVLLRHQWRKGRVREPVKWRAVSPQGTSSSGSEPRCSRRTAATHRPRPDRAATCGASGRLPGRPPLDRRGAAASGNTGAILISFIDGADGGAAAQGGGGGGSGLGTSGQGDGSSDAPLAVHPRAARSHALRLSAYHNG